MSQLTKQELICFLSVQLAHIHCKHFSEAESTAQAINYAACACLGFYALEFGAIFHWSIDTVILFVVHQIIGLIGLRIKCQHLLTEADIVGFQLANQSGATKEDMVSMMTKFNQIYQKLPFLTQFRNFQYYEKRIEFIRNRLA